MPGFPRNEALGDEGSDKRRLSFASVLRPAASLIGALARTCCSLFVFPLEL